MATKKETTKKKPGPKPKAKAEVPQGTPEVKKAAPKAKGRDWKAVLQDIHDKVQKRPHTRRQLLNLMQTELNKS